MEYSPLGDLVNLIETSNINQLNIKDIFKQLLISVNHFHQIGFIHRDIKPENFLLFENGMIKLIDFGFCERKDKLTKANMGTPGYIAPEILLINECDNCREELNGEAGVILTENGKYFITDTCNGNCGLYVYSVIY